METSELRLVLKQCFSLDQLQTMTDASSWSGDPYDSAVDAVLCEDEAGAAICDHLDLEAERQRGKVRSMTVAEIRKSLSPEFLEPGKTLGLILWSLLRDERIGVRNLASEIANHFMPLESTETGADDFIRSDEILADEELDVDELLQELSGGNEGGTDGVEDEPDFRDLDELLEMDEDGDEETEAGTSSASAEMSDEELDSLLNQLEEESEDEDFSLPVHAYDEDDEPEYGETEPYGSDETRYVALGGVEISLASLKRACEKVFEESVELVVDENLTRDDKIVVVGKRCGVKVLYGPHYTIQQPEAPRSGEKEKVIVEPLSLQVALARVYQEQVELIPDSSLLEEGVIAFAGKITGIEVITNPSLSVPLPDWAENALVSTTEPGLKSKVDALEKRLVEMEKRAVAVPAAAQPAPPAPEPDSEPEPEMDMDFDDDLADADPIPIEDIETEELEPVTEEIPIDLSEEHEDLLAEESGDAGIDELESLVIGDEINEDDLTDDSGDELADAGDEDELDEAALDDLDLDDLDVDALTGEDDEPETPADAKGAIPPIAQEEDDPGSEDIDEEIDLDSLAGELDEFALEEGDDSIGSEEIDLDDLDLDLDLDLDDSGDGGDEGKEVFNGETVLLLGGEEKHANDYDRIIGELGGSLEWHYALDSAGEDEIAEMVERADLIMTLSTDAVADPGILQATNIAQESNKRIFTHHSASPSSVKKQLVKLVEEGKV